MLALAEQGALDHFALDESRLGAVADYVVDAMRANFPDGEIPYHSRWRHFSVGGVDRWHELAERLTSGTADEVARSRFDLVVTSVLLDAGAGPDWRYLEPRTGHEHSRSEGLAVASLDFFASGVLSGDDRCPLRVDAQNLVRLDDVRLAEAFQATDDNPLVGLAGRAELLRRLGRTLNAMPTLFGQRHPRIGNLYDHLAERTQDGRIPATDIFDAVLTAFGPIWPGRLSLAGQNLGDVWPHPKLRHDDPTDGLIPFHKLSQWLTYSLVEPLEDAGILVANLDALTGLAEYRNGGLFVDLGALQPKHEAVTSLAHRVGSEVIVEWRALTVALLDRLADEIRARMGQDAERLPLAKILEGGTWSAGRRIAEARRIGGGPPIQALSDGTVF